MGFLDKAKKMAEQAQAKLDEAQKQFNTGQGGGGQASGPVVEYDKHGRPIQPSPVTPDAPAASTPPAATPGVPPTAPPEPVATPAPPEPPAPAAGPVPDPGAPGVPGTAPTAPPTPPGPPAADDRNRPSTEPPKLSSGDPLAG
jgi:hypothetical protein